MKRKYIVLLISLILLTLIIFKLAFNKKMLDEKNQPSLDSTVRIPVKVVKVNKQLESINLVKTGILAPFKEAKVLSAGSGTIRELRFNLGDHVAEGQVLVQMDTYLARLELQRTETKAAKLRHDLDTYTELLQGQAATQEKVNEIRQSYLDAVNQVNQVKKQITDAGIKAPFSGVISERLIEQGVFVNPGTPIASIVNLSPAKVQVNLTETEVYQVVTGQKVKISTDLNLSDVLNGKISFISPQANETHNYKVEIIVDNKRKNSLRSGTFVYADFSRKTTLNILLIPRDALTLGIKDASVYVVENNVVHQKHVKTGMELNGMIQVTSGLEAGEVVVTSGQINLKDGAQITISQ